ncbi:hypothetical protein NHX12_029925 [Muraenolepis orangiensis]|uniref:Uncharacterized protein n=1 Tax=Muraenolepis orangiensis TaxID=630683 RepID=A0A9Q0E8I7_9TELE|nr:hypothetical protein NHX12_029925 [Muraenolepis orangiensis]
MAASRRSTRDWSARRMRYASQRAISITPSARSAHPSAPRAARRGSTLSQGYTPRERRHRAERARTARERAGALRERSDERNGAARQKERAGARAHDRRSRCSGSLAIPSLESRHSSSLAHRSSLYLPPTCYPL